MITRLNEPCFVLTPDPGSNWHYTHIEAAARALHSHIEDVRSNDDPEQLRRAEQIVIEQRGDTCGVLTCNSCGTEYEDEETSGNHLTSVADDQAEIAAAVGEGWTRGTGDSVHCPDCPAPPYNGPGPADVPLFGASA